MGTIEPTRNGALLYCVNQALSTLLMLEMKTAPKSLTKLTQAKEQSFSLRVEYTIGQAARRPVADTRSSAHPLVIFLILKVRRNVSSIAVV